MGSNVDAVMDSAIANQKIVGAEVIAYRNGEQVIRRTAGFFDRENGVPMMENAIYRLASVTKPIVAATALAMVEKGVLALDEPVSTYLPYFTPRGPKGGTPAITIHQLLTHTSGLSYQYPGNKNFTLGLNATDLGFEENFTELAKEPLAYEPGTAWVYSCAIDVLGAAMSAVHGGSLQDAVEHYVTGPLGMSDTRFSVADASRLAIPYADGTPPSVMADPQVVFNEAGEPTNFSPSRIFNPKAFQSGGAGMAGTASDVARFLEVLRKGGEPILSSNIVARGFTNQIGDIQRPLGSAKFGYFGSVMVDPSENGSPAAPGSITWGGVYGHSWLVDPTNAITIVSFSNTALEGCTGAYPNDVFRAVYADLS